MSYRFQPYRAIIIGLRVKEIVCYTLISSSNIYIKPLCNWEHRYFFLYAYIADGLHNFHNCGFLCRFRIVLYYKYYVFGPYPSSCLYLKKPSCSFFKTRRFGDWILSPALVSDPEIGTRSIDWAQQSRFYLRTETESGLRNVVFWKINIFR
jgi:hypothetical protein